MYRKSVNPVILVPAPAGNQPPASRRRTARHHRPQRRRQEHAAEALAGIYPPTCGHGDSSRGASARCSTSALGFEPEATGWENIALPRLPAGRDAANRSSKSGRRSPSSASWATFLDMPVRYYSAGMLVRLAFSIATAIEPEVLLVDEVLRRRRPGVPGKGRAAACAS